MNSQRSRHCPRGTTIFAAAVALVVLFFAARPSIYRPIKSTGLAEALNKVRQVKFAMEDYARDFDGKYPGLSDDHSGTASANDYLGQLVADGESDMKALFWVKDSPVCAKKPPRDGPGLAPGECHWAYVTGQTADSHPERPLLLDPFRPGTTEFDPDLWERKAIVLRIDGSAKALRMRISDGKVLDGSNRDILSPQADAWVDSDIDPMTLLAQPEPAP